jgi:hypothetical protein
MMKNRLIMTAGSVALLTLSSSAALYTWDGGGANNRYSTTANWDPTAPSGGPQSGDTGTVGGTYRVEIGGLNELTTGAAITFSASSYLERNSTSAANMSGTYTFNDTTRMNISALLLQSGSTLNWNSSGTFSNAPSGLTAAAAMFSDAANSVVNMSSGLWLLDVTGTDAMDVNGTFNMIGGQIKVVDRFNVDGTFNLGGTGELYVADELIGGILNFQGTAAAFYHAGHDYDFAARLDGNVKINGVAQTDLTGFNVENVNISGTDYTKFTVIPEPATIGIYLLGSAATLIVRKVRG